MRVVADSHAVVWHLAGSDRLSAAAATALAEAEATDGVVVSVASLIDLWYVTQTTKAVTDAEVGRLRKQIESSSAFTLQAVDLAITDATLPIPRAVLADPWDRFIVATAKALSLSLVTRDEAMRRSGLVPTIW